MAPFGVLLIQNIMRYLFYDLEDATSKNNICKICEFGYVLTNEKFEVEKRGNIMNGTGK